ncbi:MAG: hypothetical protein HC822_16380 [Oscillochloris sp.]|nr:hypothetical protein [Oscillochloris sp.]
MLRLPNLTAPAAQSLVAGQMAQFILEVENLGPLAVPVSWRSHCAWAQIHPNTGPLPAHSTQSFALHLQPAAGLNGSHTIALDLHVGALPLSLVLPVQINPERWWQRLRRIFGG